MASTIITDDASELVAPALTRFNINFVMLKSIQDNFNKFQLQGFVEPAGSDTNSFINRDLLDELTVILEKLDRRFDFTTVMDYPRYRKEIKKETTLAGTGRRGETVLFITEGNSAGSFFQKNFANQADTHCFISTSETEQIQLCRLTINCLPIRAYISR